MVRIVAGGDTITATNNHPIYLPQLGKYLRADSLRQNMKLLALTGALLTVHAVEAFDTTLQVYNFEVEEYHNYFVGEEGVLVHNDCALVKAGLRQVDDQGAAVFDRFDEAFTSLPLVEKQILKEQFRAYLESANDDLLAFFRGTGYVGDLPLAEVQVQRVRAWEVGNYLDLPSTNVDFLSALSARIIDPINPFTREIAEEVFVRAEILDEALGSTEVKNIITELVGNEKFVNHEDLLINLNSCFSSNDIPNLSKLNTQLNEFREGQYWISRGEDIKISKELNPGQQYNNEVDGILLNSNGILECKYPYVTGPNATNNVFANLQSIIGKFTIESRLTQFWKDIYPQRYGQINIANGSFSNLSEPSEFVQAVRDAGIIGDELGISFFTQAELQSLDELHLIVGDRRIIIRPDHWD